jgi:phospholipid-binding lipoprotein MlaA
MVFSLRTLFPVVAVAILGTVSGCTLPSAEQAASGEIFDPFEESNRGVHAFNRDADRLLFRPTSKGYASVIPTGVQDSIGYFSDNLSMPGNALDSLLQGNLKQMGQALARFAINTTIGFGGFGDAATAFGIPAVDTDFGETLYVWGVPAGAYLELPILGPSTQRDAVGTFVNLFTNPLTFAPVRIIDNIGVYAEVLRRLGDRGRFSDTYDSILYESADSYAQTRVIYLQNRKFELARGKDGAYFDVYSDPYADPYEDIYAE